MFAGAVATESVRTVALVHISAIVASVSAIVASVSAGVVAVVFSEVEVTVFSKVTATVFAGVVATVTAGRVSAVVLVWDSVAVFIHFLAILAFRKSHRMTLYKTKKEQPKLQELSTNFITNTSTAGAISIAVTENFSSAAKGL